MRKLKEQGLHGTPAELLIGLCALLPDQASQDRLEEVRKELAALEEQLRPLEMRYQAEKRILDELRELQRKRDELKTKLAEAENRMDLAMVADIKCVALACLRNKPLLETFRPADTAWSPSTAGLCVARERNMCCCRWCTLIPAGLTPWQRN